MSRKIPLPALIVSAALLVAWLVGGFTARSMQSPRDRLFATIDAKVDLAQRLLASYDPSLTRLAHSIGPDPTVPEGIEELWSQLLETVEYSENALNESLRKQGQEMRRLAERFAQLSGSRPEAALATPDPRQSYAMLRENLDRNGKILSEALAVLQEAIGLSEGEHSGSEHPSATRLEAMLCGHQADMLRRQAELHRMDAEDARQKVLDLSRRWAMLDQQAASLLRGITGASSAGPSSSIPLSEQIRRLEVRRAEVAGQAAEAEKQVAELTTRIEQTSAAVEAARTEARAAQNRMMELQALAEGALDESALQRFIEEYNLAAEKERLQGREFATLNEGSIRNAHVPAREDDAVLNDPLEAVDDSQPLAVERGRVALETDLAAARAVLEGYHELIGQIDREIASCQARQKGVEQHVALLRKQQEQIVAEARQAAREAFAAAMAGLKIAEQALSIAEGRGLQAAQRARRAAESRISEARELNATNSPDAPNPRLTMIADDNNQVGVALMVMGDLHLIAARVQALQLEEMSSQQNLLRSLQGMGLAVDAAILPEDTPPDAVPAVLVNAEEAGRSTVKLRSGAVASAQAALENYQQAEGPLRQLWVLHAQIAAVHYFLSHVLPEPAAGEQRTLALEVYKRALANLSDRPEARIYADITADLSQ